MGQIDGIKYNKSLLDEVVHKKTCLKRYYRPIIEILEKDGYIGESYFADNHKAIKIDAPDGVEKCLARLEKRGAEPNVDFVVGVGVNELLFCEAKLNKTNFRNIYSEINDKIEGKLSQLYHWHNVLDVLEKHPCLVILIPDDINADENKHECHRRLFHNVEDYIVYTTKEFYEQYFQ